MRSIFLLFLAALSPLYAKDAAQKKAADLQKLRARQAKKLKACEAAPRSSMETTACVEAGTVFLNKGFPEEAQKIFEKGCALNNPESCGLAGETAKGLGKTAEARKSLKQGCSQEWWAACESLGDLEEKAGRIPDSVEAFRPACTHDLEDGKEDTQACARFGKAKAALPAGKKK